MSMEVTSAYRKQMLDYLGLFTRIFPVTWFPWIILGCAAVAQNIAWFSSHLFSANLDLVSRVGISWSVAFVEYLFLIPGMNIAAHVLNMSHVSIIVILHSLQLIAYTIMNKLIIKERLSSRKLIALVLILIAIILVHGEAN